MDNKLIGRQLDTIDRYEMVFHEYEYTFIKVISCLADGSKWYNITGFDIVTNEVIEYSDKSFDRILDVAKYALEGIQIYMLENDCRFHDKIFVTKNIKGDKNRYTIDILEEDDIDNYRSSKCYRYDDREYFTSYYDMSNYNLDEYNDKEYPWGIGNY